MLPRDYYSSSLALIKKSNFTEGIKKIVFAPNCLFSSIILILLLSFFFSVYGEILQIHVVRHDAVLMINGYWGKMVSEGRWVNYFIFSLLKKIPAQVAYFLSLVFWTYFVYQVASRFTSDRWLVWIFTALSLQFPSFYSLLGWAWTPLPAFAILALVAYLSNKLTFSSLCIISGILFFGTYNNFYNLIPLLYIKQISNGNLKRVIYYLFWWIAGYLIGFLFMLIVVKILAGNWGLQIEDWRKPNEIKKISDIIKNATRVWLSFQSNINIVGKNLFVLSFGLSLVFALISLVTKIKPGKKTIVSLLVILAVISSGYFQSIPYGLGVGIRTAVFLYAAVFSLLLVLCHQCRTIGLLFVVLFASNLYLKNVDSVNFYASLTNSWRKSLTSINVDPASTSIVHICSTAEEVRISSNKIVKNLQLRNFLLQDFSSPYRQYPILKSIGFNSYDNDLKKCSNYRKETKNDTSLHQWLFANNELYIWYK